MKKLFIIPLMLILLVSFVSASLTFNSTVLFYDNGLVGSEYPKSCDYNFNTGKFYFSEHRFIEEYTSIDGLGRFEGSALYNTLSVDTTQIAFATPNINDTGYTSVDYIAINGTHLNYVAHNTPSTVVTCSRTTSFDDITSDNNYFYGLDKETDIITVFDYNEDCSYSIIETKLLPILASDITYFTITNETTFYGGNGDDKIYQIDYNMFLRDTYLLNNSDFINMCVDTDFLFFVNNTNYAYVSKYELPSEPSVIPLTLVNGEYYSDNYCITNTMFCNDTIYIDNGAEFPDIYCNNLGTDCSLTGSVCEYDNVYSPTYDTYYNTGYCTPPTCDSECSFTGYRECLSPNSYTICGNYDTDSCRELSPETTCLDNQYCSNGLCVEYNFSAITDLTIDLPSFFIKPELSTDEKILIAKDVNDVYQVRSEYNIYTQKVAYLSPLTTQTFYNSYDCDYQETVVYDNPSSNTNNSFDYDIILNDEIGVVEFTIDLNGSNQANISLTDGMNDLAKLNVYYNDTTYNLLVYIESTSQVLFNDTGFKTYDDLESIDFIISNGNALRLYDVYMKVNRYTPIEYQSVLIDYDNSFSLGVTNLVITSTNNVTVSNIYAYYVDDRYSFDDLTLGSYDEIVCTYTKTGCYNIRSYVLGVDYAIYNNYDDIKVCVNTLGGTQLTTTQQSFADQINEYGLGVKLFILLFIVGLTAFMFFVVGDNDNNLKKAVGIGLIAGELIFFIVVGLIPAWIVVFPFIIIALWVTGFLRKAFTGV